MGHEDKDSSRLQHLLFVTEKTPFPLKFMSHLEVHAYPGTTFSSPLTPK